MLAHPSIPSLFWEPKLVHGKDKRHSARPRPKAAPSGPPGSFWLYGLHAARAALANPKRKVLRAVLTASAAHALKGGALGRVAVETVDSSSVGKLLPEGAVHQGAALLCAPLARLDLADVLDPLAGQPRLVAILDQITDPQNEGAILRSAAAFGVAAVVVQDRHAPPESGALAKAASGALDIVPRVVTVNIARALEELGRMGFWRIALAADGDIPLKDAAGPGDIAIVLGAEGSGIRRLVRERCDASAFIPLNAAMESLNVSTAAAIALYELAVMAGIRKNP